MNIRSLASALRSPKARVDHLRIVVETIKTSKRLDDFPGLMADLLQCYDEPSTDSALRADIHELLASSVEIAQILLHPTFSADEAMVLIGNHQRILSQVLRYLSQRPRHNGYSILIIKTGTLMGQFTTEAEAEGQLKLWRSIGNCPDAIVTPVTITSMHALRPEGAQLHENDPIPDSVRPEPTQELSIDGPYHPTLTSGPVPTDDGPATAPNHAAPASTGAERTLDRPAGNG